MGALRTLVEQHYRNVSEADYRAEESVFSPDVVTVDPVTGTMEGLAAFKAYEEGFHRAFPDGRLMLRSAGEAGNTIAVEGVFSGTHGGPLVGPAGEVPATHRRLDLPFGDFFEVEAGRITRHRIYYDQVALMQQLGLMPSPAGA